MKSKNIAGFLALFFGIFGVHRFYLGRRVQGILHMALFFITMLITAEANQPAIMIPALLGFIDAILLFAMPREDFDEKYNAKRLHKKRRVYEEDEAYEERYAEAPAPPKKKSPSGDFLKRAGIEKFRSGDFMGAIESFMQTIETTAGESPSVHFNLACSYSMLHDAPSAFEHLEKAIKLGFNQFQKIQTHFALAYVREQPEFPKFVQNGYVRMPALPQPEPSLLDSKPTQEPKEVIDQLFHLGDLLEKGLLTEDEFRREKQKLLGE